MTTLLKIGGFIFAIAFLVSGPDVLLFQGRSVAAETRDLQTIILRIEGMSCGGWVKACERPVESVRRPGRGVPTKNEMVLFPAMAEILGSAP